MLSGSYEKKWKAHGYPFTEKWLVINNIDDHVPSGIWKALKADRIVVADDYAEKALFYFGLKKEDLGESYVYSICELVELYLAKDFDYLVHQASDILVTNHADWIKKGFAILQSDPEVVTVAPNNEDSITYGLKNKFFSDQCYLVPVEEFRRKIYWFKEPSLSEYPAKGGDALFERRVGRYLHNLGKYRQLVPDAYYAHPAY